MTAFPSAFKRVWHLWAAMMAQQKGFSLIETLLSMAILSMLGIGFIMAASHLTRIAGASENKVLAAIIASNAQVRQKVWPSGRSNITYTTAQMGKQFRVQISPLSDSPQTMQKVMISVWDLRGETQYFRQTAFIPLYTVPLYTVDSQSS